MQCFGAGFNRWGVVLLLVTLEFLTAKGQFQSGFNPSPTGAVGCPERNGRFAVPSQCDAYIECEEGVGEQKLCPDGLLFNPRARFTYPCQYPAEVDCEGRNVVQPAQPTADCPHQFGYYREGDANNCGKFRNCANGVGHIFDCPEGLAFNDLSLRCDWPDQVETCNAEAFLGFTCPNVGQQNSLFSSDGYQYFRSPTNCQKYFICINGRPRLFSCGEGQAFNELTYECDGIENVTGCGVSPGRQQSFVSPGFSASPTLRPPPPQPTSFGVSPGFGTSPGFGSTSGFGAISGFGAAPQQQFSQRPQQQQQFSQRQQQFSQQPQQQFGPQLTQFRPQREDSFQAQGSRSNTRDFRGSQTFGPQRINLLSNNFFDNSLQG